MNRISQLFNKLKADNKSALGIFITAGDPDIELSQKKGFLKSIIPNHDVVNTGGF